MIWENSNFKSKNYDLGKIQILGQKIMIWKKFKFKVKNL